MYEMNKTSTTLSYCCDDDNNNVKGNGGSSENEILNIDANKNENYLIDGDSFCRKRIPQIADNEDCDSMSDNDESCDINDDLNVNDDDDDDDDSEVERQIGDGIDEKDSFLVATAVASAV